MRPRPPATNGTNTSGSTAARSSATRASSRTIPTFRDAGRDPPLARRLSALGSRHAGLRDLPVLSPGAVRRLIALELVERRGRLEPLRLEPRERPCELALSRDRGDKALLRALDIGVARREPRIERVFLGAEPLEILFDRELPRLQRLALIREA